MRTKSDGDDETHPRWWWKDTQKELFVPIVRDMHAVLIQVLRSRLDVDGRAGGLRIYIQ